jgi:subtilisin-like proprotein convertase family protein
MKKIYAIVIILFFIQKITLAQLTVQDSIAGQQLANLLAGPEINVFNAVLFDTTHNQSGTFNYIGNDLAGINSGIILATGDINYALGPNTAGGTSGPANYSIPYNDSLLSALADTIIYDYVTLEFEFEAPSDAVEFNYIFLSEEYNAANTLFNDAFAFTISGPGIVGEENIAILPNTGAPITINTVSLYTNWQYFNNNVSGAVNIEYDGFTSLLTARKTGLQPCQVYKISLRIADGGDRIYDSAVMLQANSLKANSITAVSSTYSTDTTALEGCISARYTFDLGYTTVQDINIPIRLEGTALNGIDYEFIDSIITIPAGQSSSTIIVNALSDGLVEGRESIQLIYSPSTSICIPNDTVILYVDDAIPLSYSTVGTNLTCPEDSSGSIMVNITGGFPPYTVEYADTTIGLVLSVSDIQLPITNLNRGTYTLDVYDQYGCSADVIVSGGLFDAGQTFLPDGTGVSYTNDINITGFNIGQSLNSIQQINAICATLEHSYASDLSIELIAPNGSAIQLKGVGNTGSGVYTCNLGEPVASGPTDMWSASNLTAGVGYQYCWSLNPTYGTMFDVISPLLPGPPPTYNYTTLAGNTYTDYYLPAGSYTPRQSFYGLLGAPLNGNWQLRVTDNYPQDNGYLFDWSISLSADLPDSIITLNAPNPPMVIDSVVNATCNSSDGAIYLVIAGTNPPYSYQWNTGATTQNLLGVAAGTYIVTVTGANNCTHVHSTNVSNIGGAIITDSINHVSCYGSNDGSIDLSITSGTYTYNWSNGGTTEDLSNLSEGFYTLTLTTGTGCVTIETFEIFSPNPIISIGNILNENCGDREGEINLTIQGGALPYTYNWSNAASTKNIEDLQQGFYAISIVDNNNCLYVDSFNIINLVGNCIPSCDLIINNTQLVHENCLNTNGGISLSATTTGGTLNYLWSNGTILNQITNLSAGIYTVTISDTRGCEIIEFYSIINQTNGLTFVNLNTKDDDCNNLRGEAHAAVFGGVQPYSYLWSNGATTASIFNLSQGIYACTVTDASTCKVSANDTIRNLINLEPSYVNILDASCGDSTGSIDITIPGSYPFTWSILWSNGLTDPDQRNITGGIYSFVLTDSVGCEYISPDYVIGNNAGNLMIDNIDIDYEICGDQSGEIILNLAGGNLPYSYVWNTGATSSAIQNLSTGSYSATITDSLGCTIETLPLAIGNSSGNLTIDAIVVREEHCNNATGSIDLAISGNQGTLTYQWNNGSTSPNLNNLSSGNYTCTITDSQGCLVTARGTVSNSSGALSIIPTLISPEYCGQQDGSINLTTQNAVLPITYQWSNGATTENLTGLSQGIYELTVTDDLGCVSIINYTIQNNTGSLASNLLSLTNEVCNNSMGEIAHVVTGGFSPYSYQWSNGDISQNLANLSTGNYYCTITDGSGCQLLVGPYLINNSSDILVDTAFVTDAFCGLSNGAIDILVTGGISPYSYQWSNNSTTQDISALSLGIYTCTITDSMGCQAIVSYMVDNLNNGLNVNQVSVLDEVCSDGQGAIDITVQGGTLPYSYLWSNAMTSEDLLGLNSGTYTVSISDAQGCSTTQAYRVSNNSGSFQLANVNVVSENCNNTQGSINVNLNGGLAPITYEWSNGATTKDILGLTAGVYTQTITDANGCILLHSVNIQNQAGQMLVNDSIVLPTCRESNGLIALNVDHGISPISFSWQNGAITAQIDSLSSGVYTCIVSDSIGCTVSYNINLQESSIPLQILGIGATNSICNRGTGSASASIVGGASPYYYSWTTTANECGNYTLNMYNNSSILTTLSWAHVNYDPPMIKVTVNDSTYGYFAVSPLVGFVKNTFEQAAIYVCTGDSIKLEYLSPFSQSQFGYELLDGQGNLVFREASISIRGLSYADTVKSFVTGQGTPTLNGLTSGAYTLTVVDSNGCEDSRSLQINSTSGNLNIQAQSILNETCGMKNGAIAIDIHGGILPLNYQWNTGISSEDLINLENGVYTLTVTDQIGCIASENFAIINDANGMVVQDTLIQVDSCNTSTGMIDITVTGGANALFF